MPSTIAWPTRPTTPNVHDNPLSFTDPTGHALSNDTSAYHVVPDSRALQEWLHGGAPELEIDGTVTVEVDGGYGNSAGMSGGGMGRTQSAPTADDLASYGEPNGAGGHTSSGNTNGDVRVAYNDTTGKVLGTVARGGALRAAAGAAVPVLLSVPILLATTTSTADDDGTRQTIYRAVDPTELAYLKAHGNYGLNPNASGKYFALTPAGVLNFVSLKQSAERDLTITFTTVPREIIETGHQYNDAGAAGPSVHFKDIQLPVVYGTMTPVVIVPKK
jgi:hypothetical protein